MLSPSATTTLVEDEEEEESTDGLGLEAEDRLDDDLEDRREFPPFFEFLPLPLTLLLLLLLLLLLCCFYC